MILRSSPGSIVLSRLWLLPTFAAFAAVLRLNKVGWDLSKLAPAPFLYIVFIWIAFTAVTFLIAATSVSVEEDKVVVKKVTGTREIPRGNFEKALYEKNNIVVLLPDAKQTPYSLPRVGFSKEDWTQLLAILPVPKP